MELERAFDSQLEMDLIGSMILDPAKISEVADILKPEHFYHRVYRLSYERMLKLWREDETSVDLVNIVTGLTDQGVLATKLIETAESVYHIGNVRSHAERLRDLWSLREVLRIGNEMTQLGALRDPDEIRNAINEVESKVANVLNDANPNETLHTLEDSLYRFAQKFEAAYQRGEGITGLPSGFTDLDTKTAGFQKSDLIIIGGRPSMGKTAFALQLAKNISKNNTTLFFSLEMSSDALSKRMIAEDATVDLQKLNTGLVTDAEYERYVQSMGNLSRHKLMIDDQPGLTIQDMRARARRVKRERGLSCIILDYLQFVQGSGRKDRHLEVAEITRQLKMMAKEFDIPIIALAQLSRTLEQRQDKRPMMSDLRESGSIEQDADLIMFLYRDEYYNTDTEDRNIVEVIIGKQRNGPTGVVKLCFFKEVNQFRDLVQLKRM
jgi:replicative DNA helicase